MNSIYVRFVLLIVAVIGIFILIAITHIHFGHLAKEFPGKYLFVLLPSLLALSWALLWWIGYLGFDIDPREKH